MNDRKINFKDLDISGSRLVLAGVGGVGMSALAQLLLAKGAQVVGTDRLHDQGVTTTTLAKLECLGVAMAAQDGSAIVHGCDALIVSTAVEDDNPDIRAARSNGIPIRHRAQMLADCIADQRCIAVGGTSGKSTITGMLGWIFEQLGLDPTVLNGAPVLNWVGASAVGNVRVGAGDLAIVEADESDRSLLRFTPELATISNISRDHFQMEETIELFSHFARQTKGAVVVGPSVPVERFEGAEIVQADFDREPGGRAFHYHGQQFHLPLPGRHNLENALVAVALCERFGLEASRVAEALATFGGIERRLQTVGCFQGARVVDDYAHNPAKITAAWRTVADEAERVIAIWRPHGFGPLHAMRTELLATFKTLCTPRDHLIIMPVYYAGGSTDRRTTSRDFVELMRDAGVVAEYVSDYDELQDYLQRTAGIGDTILMMGARDPQIAQFAHELVQ